MGLGWGAGGSTERGPEKEGRGAPPGYRELLYWKGFWAEPISFSLPDAHFFLDDKGNVQGKRFVLTPTSEKVGILLYMALEDYHWESGDGSEVVIVKVGNPGFQSFFQDPRYRPHLGAVANLTPAGFLSILGKKGSRQGIDA